MDELFGKVERDMMAIISEWQASPYLSDGIILVIGCSTSEVSGKDIGTSGSEKVAEILFRQLHRLSKENNIHLAFQGCEHINRAITLERSVAERKDLEIVSVVPSKNAGGSMATHAYHHLENPVVVEEIEADLGMDIGHTFIGMHLKKVAVPIRFNQSTLGKATVTFARTRPKLIGGERAIYK